MVYVVITSKWKKNIEHRVVIKFCFKVSKIAMITILMLIAVYGKSVMSCTRYFVVIMGFCRIQSQWKMKREAGDLKERKHRLCCSCVERISKRWL